MAIEDKGREREETGSKRRKGSLFPLLSRLGLSSTFCRFETYSSLPPYPTLPLGFGNLWVVWV